MSVRPSGLHDYQFTVPLTLRPSSTPDEIFKAMVAAASLRQHIDRLDVQAWALSLASEWEERFVSQGWECFSLGYGDIDSLEKVPYAQMWFNGKKTTYVREWNSISGDWVISSTEIGLNVEDLSISSKINGFIFKHLKIFPVDPRQRRWASAFCTPQGLTVDQWRQSILCLLDEADLARYESIELGVQTPDVGQSVQAPTRL
jgi:hypothetical protein